MRVISAYKLALPYYQAVSIVDTYLYSMSTIALLLVDVQQGFDHPTHWGVSRSNPSSEDNIKRLLNHFRNVDPTPLIIHVQHNSFEESSPLYHSSAGVAFQPWSTPLSSELVIKKNVNSAFIGTNLESVLREHGIRKLFICGWTTDQCVSTTVRMAANMHVCDSGDEKGEVILVGDATAAWGYAGIPAETIHQVHEATLGHEFCRVMNTQGALKDISTAR